MSVSPSAQLVAGVVPVTVSSLVTEEKFTKLFVDADDVSAQKYRIVDHPGHHRLSRAPFRALANFIPALKCLIVVVDATDSRGAHLRDVAECVRSTDFASHILHTLVVWLQAHVRSADTRTHR